MSDFRIEKRAGIDVLVFADGGCRPASQQESWLYAENRKLRECNADLEIMHCDERNENKRLREALNMVRHDATMPDWLEGVVEAALRKRKGEDDAIAAGEYLEDHF